jgi:hypothetical protein
MKSRILTGAITSMIGTVCFVDGWVVGDRATSECRIVTRNPAVIGDIWFEDGPYGSPQRAKLTRSMIGACLNDDRRAGLTSR